MTVEPGWEVDVGVVIGITPVGVATGRGGWADAAGSGGWGVGEGVEGPAQEGVATGRAELKAPLCRLGILWASPLPGDL